MASALETKLGGLFENCQKATSMITDLADMGHQHWWQRTIQRQTESSTERQNKNILSNRHDILLVQGQNTTKPFPHILGRGKKKPSGLCHKTPPNLAPYNN